MNLTLSAPYTNLKRTAFANRSCSTKLASGMAPKKASGNIASSGASNRTIKLESRRGRESSSHHTSIPPISVVISSIPPMSALCRIHCRFSHREALYTKRSSGGGSTRSETLLSVTDRRTTAQVLLFVKI